MPRTRNPYPAEFRDQIVALTRTGRRAESLAREFEPCVATIHAWINQANINDSNRGGGLTNEEGDELRRLRRENCQLRQERDILAKAAAWFAQSDVMPPRDRSTPPSPSAYGAKRPAQSHPLDQSARHMITRCAKASLRTWNANCSTVVSSRPKQRPAWRFSNSSNAGTIRAGAIPLLDISLPSTTKGVPLKC